MKNLGAFFGLLLCIFLSLVFQQFIPALTVLGSARVDLVPIFFCYGALLLPFPLAILLALCTGFLVDMANLQILSGHVEIALGWSIFVYVLFAFVLQGFRPVFLRGRWEIHAFASGICTILFLLAQFIMITVRRGEVEIPTMAMAKILVPGSVAFLLAPVVYFSAKAMGLKPNLRKMRDY
ncbi:MAG: hypothetical protein ABI615_12230 [Chthoniobacterales bacterium]